MGLEEILNKLRESADISDEGILVSLPKIELIRLVDYIDKLEDENLILRTFADRNIQINLNK